MIEILGTVAFWIMRFEMESGVVVGGGQKKGAWSEPRTDNNDVVSSIGPPTSPLMVRLKEREGWCGDWGSK